MTIGQKYGGQALVLAKKMQLEAAVERHPQHEQHVRNTIDYANAVAAAYTENLKEWILAEIPKIVDQTVEMKLKEGKVQMEVDEASYQVVKKKVADLFKSIF